MSHGSDSLDFILREAKPTRGGSEEHCVLAQQVGAEGEDIIGL